MLGMRIACLRRRCGLSQKELASRLCLSASAVGMYEQDRREPSTELLIAMAKLFGVTTDFLLTGESAEEEEFLLLEKLSRVSGLPIPPSLAELPHLPERHKSVIAKDAMARFVLDGIAKK